MPFRKVNLNSATRDETVYTNPNYCSLRYQGNNLSKIKNVKLQTFQMINTIENIITNINNVFYLNEGGSDIQITLPMGTYFQRLSGSGNFFRELENLLNAATTVSNVYRISFHPMSFGILPYTTRMEVTSLNPSGGGTSAELPFSFNWIVASDRSLLSKQSPFYEMGFYVDQDHPQITTPATTQISNYTIHLENPTSVFINIAEFQNQASGTYSYTTINGSINSHYVVPVDVNYGSLINYNYYQHSDNTVYFDNTQTTIGEFSITIRDIFGNIITNQYSDWFMELLIEIE